MTLLNVDFETIPSVPNLSTREQIMAIQLEDLVQAVAEGVFRAVEARGGSHPGGQPAPAAASPTALVSRSSLISQLVFEIKFRAGGMPVVGPLGAVQTQAVE